MLQTESCFREKISANVELESSEVSKRKDIKEKSGLAKFTLIALIIGIGPICLGVFFTALDVVFPEIPNPMGSPSEEQLAEMEARDYYSNLCATPSGTSSNTYTSAPVISGTLYTQNYSAGEGDLLSLLPSYILTTDDPTKASIFICISPPIEEQIKICDYNGGYRRYVFKRNIRLTFIDVNSETVIIEKVLKGDEIECLPYFSVSTDRPAFWRGPLPTASQVAVVLEALYSSE